MILSIKGGFFMKRLISLLITVIIVFGVIFSLILFNNKSVNSNSNLNIVSTTGMINDIVINIAGDKAETISLMGSGVDPHLYKASESDVSKMENANIIFHNGLHLEGKMAEVFENMKKLGKTTVEVSEDIPENMLLEPDDGYGTHDPHIWFNVNLWIMASEKVYETLSDYDKKNSEYYKKNYENYIRSLNELNDYVIKKVKEVPEDKRVLITAHDAFNYFGNAYGFSVKGIQGISTSSEAGTKDIIELADYIAKNKIKAIFIESSIPKRNIQALQEAVKSRGFNVEIGGELFSDAMGDAGSFEGTYYGMVKHNVDTIVNALK
jgi:manganese/zinc/iron transport system substrate-binding protein